MAGAYRRNNQSPLTLDLINDRIYQNLKQTRRLFWQPYNMQCDCRPVG